MDVLTLPARDVTKSPGNLVTIHSPHERDLHLQKVIFVSIFLSIFIDTFQGDKHKTEDFYI